MKERPIIMSGDNPRLIIEGKKTQTRRIIATQPTGGTTIHASKNTFWIQRIGEEFPNGAEMELHCPYGIAGDRLYVREAFSIFGSRRYYRSDGLKTFKWTPSIHMPRRASRITLEILKVRVERLQDISNNDAIAEGMPDRGDADILYSTLWDSLHGKGSWDKNPWVWVIEFQNLTRSL